MANPDDTRAVKSLNNSEGRKRFVFKTFSQCINDIDINVFRSLDKEKAESLRLQWDPHFSEIVL